MNFHQSRIKTVSNQLAQEQCDAFLVTNPTNLSYFLGHSAHDGFLVISSRKCLFVTRQDGGAPHPTLDSVETIVVGDREANVATLAKHLTSLGVKALGVEGDHLAWNQVTSFVEQMPRVSILPMKAPIERLRSVKDPGEVEMIRAANELAGRTWKMLGVMLTEGETEPQLGTLIEQYVRRVGGRLATETPVRLGLNTGAAGSEPADVAVGDVSKMLFDATVSNSYHGRLVRSMRTPFPVSPSRKNKRERLGYNFDAAVAAVIAGQAAAAARLQEGATIEDVHAACRQAVEKAGFATGLEPIIGHGVGMQPVEYPILKAGCPDVFKSGMVIHLAPRLTLPEWGGVAVGDDYVIRGNQAIRLGQTAREFVPPAGL